MSDLVSSLYYGVRRFLRPLKRGVLAVGDALDRARHPARHRAARTAVAALRPRSVLFVCLGNVCRSPYAEWAVRDALESRGVAVASAGFIGPGRAPPDMAQAVARKRGVEHAASRSMLVTPEVLAEYVAAFHPAIIGLTGTPEQTDAVANAYRLYYEKTSAEGEANSSSGADDDGSYTVNHQGNTYLMSPEGEYLRHFSYGTPPEDMAASIRRAIDEFGAPTTEGA